MTSPNLAMLWAVVWLIWTGFLGAFYLTIPVSADQALFDYIAWSHVQGDQYYIGVAEQNWPGKMLIHELGVRLFGVHFWTFRAVDFGALLVTCFAGWALLSRNGFSIARLLFVFMYPALYVTAGFWMAGQRDIVAAGLLICAVAAILRGGGLGFFMAGLIIACSVLIRPTYLSYLAGVLILEWVTFPNQERQSVRQRLNHSCALLAGFLIPIGSVVIAGISIGALEHFYQQTVQFTLESYQDVASRSRLLGILSQQILSQWHWMSVLGAGGLILWIHRAGLVRTQVLLVGILATVLVSFVVQNKGFGYHLGGMLPLMVLGVAIAMDQFLSLYKAASSGITRLLWGGALAGSIVLASLGTIKKFSNYSANILTLSSGELRPLHQGNAYPDWAQISQAVDLIRQGSSPDDYVLQLGRHFHIPFLAERRPTSRFLSSPAAWLHNPDFSLYDDWVNELSTDLQLKRPKYVIVDLSFLALGDEIAPRPGASVVERQLIENISDYRIVQSTPYFLLLEQPT